MESSGASLGAESNESVSFHSNVISDSSLGLSNDDLVMSGRTEEFMSFIEKDSKNPKKKIIENKELLHEIELLKIELSQKSLIIDNLKRDSFTKVDELEEKLHDALHQKKILQLQLDNTKNFYKAESEKVQSKTEKDLKRILERQEELEKVNKMLEKKTENFRSEIENGKNISENEYIKYKSQPTESLSIGEYFFLRLYEGLQAHAIEKKNVFEQRDKLAAEVVSLSNKLHVVEQDLFSERRERCRLDLMNKSQNNEVSDLRKQVESNVGKIQRFDIVLCERNKFEADYNEVMKTSMLVSAEKKSLMKENEELKKENEKLLREGDLLRQDKEYLSKNLTESQVKLETIEDRLSRDNQQMEAVKQSREELYEKYASARDQARSSYEQRLQSEVDRLRLQTETELDKVRHDSKEAYEREKRSLRESRDAALAERDTAIRLRDDAEKRNEVYSNEIRMLESQVESRISEIHNTAQIKTFELDRLHLVHEETRKTLERMQIEIERKSRKLELVTTDFGDLQRKSLMTESDLSKKVCELEKRIGVYESMEKEMDDIVMQAAEVNDGKGDERMLFSYGYGANIPLTAKRRMKQSVELARRVLQLEKINSSHVCDNEKLKEEIRTLRSKLDANEKLLEESKQPMSYMIESMRKRDEEIEMEQMKSSKLQLEVEDLKKSNEKLVSIKKEMSMDVDRLLSHRQELNLIKNVVMKMYKEDGEVIDSIKVNKKTKIGESKKKFEGEGDMLRPAPVMFTKAEKECVKEGKY